MLLLPQYPTVIDSVLMEQRLYRGDTINCGYVRIVSVKMEREISQTSYFIIYGLVKGSVTSRSITNTSFALI